MGSFNINCSLTGVSIGSGDPAVLILMRRSYISSNEKNEWKITLTPDLFLGSPTNFLVPITLPIKGIYNGYGILTNIQDKKIHKPVENTWGCTINEMIKFLCGNKIKHENKLDKEFSHGLWGVWIHGNVWEKVLTLDSKINRVDENLWITPMVLELFGFEKTGRTKDKRYKDLWTHKLDLKIKIANDSHYSKVQGKPYLSFHTVGNLKKLIKRSKISVPDTLYQFPYRVWQNKEYLRNIIKTPQDDAFIERFRIGNDDTRFAFSSAYGYEPLTESYIKLLRENNLQVIELLAEYYAIRQMFSALGRPILPSGIGPQYGEDKVTAEIGRIITKVSRKNLKRWN